jgi:putative drug exporter of the RND superfamily
VSLLSSPPERRPSADGASAGYRKPPLTEQIARGCAARPRRTFAAWGVAILAALALVGTTLHGLSSSYHAVGQPESAKAAQLIAQAFPPRLGPAGDAGDVVIVHSSRYRAQSPAFRAFVSDLVRSISATGKAAGLTSYLSGGASLVSHDGHATLIAFSSPSATDVKPIVAVVQRATSPTFTSTITGNYPATNDFSKLSQTDLEHGEMAFGLPAALIVLVLVFGAVVAGLVPVAMALVSILVGLGIVALLSLAFSLSVFIVNMLTGMGLALGIDYSLFIVSRYREERTHGRTELDSIARAGATANRAVLLSGSTFVIAMFGMLFVPTQILRSLALGAIVVGIVSIVCALTLLPALLGRLGDRVNSLRVPVLARNLGRSESAEGRMWRRTVEHILRHPVGSLTASTALMLAAAVPILGLHIGSSGISSLPNSMPSKQGFVALQRYFPAQSTYPAQIVVQGSGAGARDAALVRLQGELARDSRFGPGTILDSRTDDVTLLSVPVRGDPASRPAVAAVRDLRNRLVPVALAGTGARAYVGGDAAENADYYDAVTRPTPAVLAFVLGLSFVVLLVAFRSLVIAVVSIALNLLSVGAAYGMLTLVFLHGVGASLFGFEQVHAIDAWVPLFLFSVLFGLSMDYQVFLMSRIKEHHDVSHDTTEAVASGVATTARIITGAALIIIVVFIGFAMGQLVMFQQMGFGVAIALLLDATVIRVVVLPSLMRLLGERAWYLPRALNWLPRVEIGHR